jgi:hypothetical protein
MAYANREKQRECSRRHYRKHKADYLARNNAKRHAMRDYLREQKRKPCADCKTRYPYYVMDFDHNDASQKRFELAALVNRLSWKLLKAEIAKCDVVCSNCHRERTFARARVVPKRCQRKRTETLST